MNIIDKFLARIPISEVIITTTINSYSVIERVEHGVQRSYKKRQWEPFFTFDGSFVGNYFKIQGHLIDPSGEDTSPGSFSIGIPFLNFLRIEVSPKFYGRVFDDPKTGAIIRGHFGVPFPTLFLIFALLMLVIGFLYQDWADYSLGFALFLVLCSVLSLREYLTVRKEIIDFLKGLFHEVTKADKV